VSVPGCYCGRPASYLIHNEASGRKIYVCDRDECEWRAHCRLLNPGMYQAPGALLRPEPPWGKPDGLLPP